LPPLLPSSALGDLRVGGAEHRVDQKPDERDDEHADCPTGLGCSGQVRSPKHVDDSAHPHDQEEHDRRNDEDLLDHLFGADSTYPTLSAWASVQDCNLTPGKRRGRSRGLFGVLAMVDTAERLLDRDVEASDDAGVAASRE
jgi:hypothetical protein